MEIPAGLTPRFNLNSRISAKVEDYDVFIDELNTWAPILSFMPIKLKHIINMLNRGMAVVFENKQDEIDTFLFIKQYNTIAREENAKAKQTVLPVPDKAEEFLTARLKFESNYQSRIDNKGNPLISIERGYTPVNPMKKSSMKNQTKKVIVRKKMYEVLDLKENQEIHIKSDLDDIELNH